MIRVLGFGAAVVLSLTAALAAGPAEASFTADPLGIGAKLQASTDSFRLPLAQPKAPIRNFLRPSSDWGAGHRGVDFLTEPNQGLLAPHGGQIGHAGLVFGVPTVVLKRPDGSSSVFQPACLNPQFELLQEVSVGEEFAAVCVGSKPVEHCPLPTCLHWGFRLAKDVYLNPLKFTGTFEFPVLLATNQARG